MTKAIHKIDPHADTVIFLKNTLKNFAIWNDPSAKITAPEESLAGEDPDEEAVPEESVAESNACEDFSDNATEYHVSSNHLKLGSLHFERMLSGGKWKEGIPNEGDGCYHITVEDWDEEAFLIFLNGLHLRNRQVPRTVSLDMLAKIVLLIDYYDCAEPFELLTEIWVTHLKTTQGVPSQPCRDLMLWMYIAWVLRLPKEFKDTTSIAIKQTKESELCISDLPIAAFVDSIHQARIQAISDIISKLHDLLAEYLDNNHKCQHSSYSFECGSFLYGALSKEMNSLSLLSPYPQAPFSNRSLWEIDSKVRLMKSPRWSIPNRYSPDCSCSLNDRVRKIADEIMHTVHGLSLEDFGRAPPQ